MRSVVLCAVAIAGCAALHAQVTVVASGLNNPRGLAFAPNGTLYVAEAGCGGSGPCHVSTDLGTRCYGATGAITALDFQKGTQTRVATGLPSIARQGGVQAAGPHDISFQGHGNGFFTIGFGGNPATRTQLGGVGGYFGHLARLTPDGSWSLVTDLGAYEAERNPDGDEPNTNPYGVLALPGKCAVADAGANDLLQVDANGNVTTLAVFPERTVTGPGGAEIKMDAVPTAVAVGPDGYYYVSQLTGFPFPVGGANVYRVPPDGGTPEVYATGFSAIIDLTFGSDGSLYVLQIAKNLLAAFGANNWTASLYRVSPGGGTRTELAAGQLTAPGGVAVDRDGTVYVTNKSIYCGQGEVLRITQ